MAQKKDFTEADRDRYAGIIGAVNAEPAKETEKRHYNRLDPRQKAPKEYRFTARMPGEFGRFLNELAYRRRSTITAEIQRLVKEEMERNPDIIRDLEEMDV